MIGLRASGNERGGAAPSPEIRGNRLTDPVATAAAVATLALAILLGLLSRLRVEVEPVLLLVTLLPLFTGIDRLQRAHSGGRHELQA